MDAHFPCLAGYKLQSLCSPLRNGALKSHVKRVQISDSDSDSVF